MVIRRKSKNKAVKAMKLYSKVKSKQDNTKTVPNQRRYILNKNSGFYMKEAYKTLRTNIRFFLHGNNCKKICITSSTMGEGKSITMLNLAISFAEDGKKVLLIDADMRRPALARLLMEKAAPGLSNVLAGLADVDVAIRENIYPNLDVLFSGDIPPNPSELLGSFEMKKMLDTLSGRYDYILVDTPPVNMVADTCVVADMLDGVLYLVRQGRTEKDCVRRGVSQLQLTGAKVLGFVMNGIDPKANKRYYAEYK